MTTLCWAACKLLIEQQPQQQRKKLLEFLPASQVAEIQKASKQKTLFSSLSPYEVIDTIHPSWLVHILQPYSENERCFFLASLKPALAIELKKLLGIKRPLPTLTPLGKEYLRKELLSQIRKERGEAFAIDTLSEDSLTVLLTLEARQLSTLSFWLGLYDLSDELRYVIDKQTWHLVEAALTPAEWQMVKSFQIKKERLAFGRMPLKNAVESAPKLRLMIEQYGINRFAKALYGEHSSLLWHLTLHMEQKRAEFFSKLCTPLTKPELKETLKNQVLGLIPLLTERSK